MLPPGPANLPPLPPISPPPTSTRGTPSPVLAPVAAAKLSPATSPTSTPSALPAFGASTGVEVPMPLAAVGRHVRFVQPASPGSSLTPRDTGGGSDGGGSGAGGSGVDDGGRGGRQSPRLAAAAGAAFLWSSAVGAPDLDGQPAGPGPAGASTPAVTTGKGPDGVGSSGEEEEEEEEQEPMKTSFTACTHTTLVHHDLVLQHISMPIKWCCSGECACVWCVCSALGCTDVPSVSRCGLVFPTVSRR